MLAIYAIKQKKWIYEKKQNKVGMFAHVRCNSEVESNTTSFQTHKKDFTVWIISISCYGSISGGDRHASH